jgi:hypothetical protein
MFPAAYNANLRITESVFEYACHEDNHGMSNMLSAARALERTQREAGSNQTQSGR